MRRKRVIAFGLLILMLAVVSGAAAQSDWWLNGNAKGDKKNTYTKVKVGDVIVFGQYNKAALKWRVLEIKKEKALVICTASLASQPFNMVGSNYATWESCTLRKWLNEFYLSDAFSKSQRKRIQLTTVDNSLKQHQDVKANAYDQPATKDYVYLLSRKEVYTYFPDREPRKMKCGAWWTRSPGDWPNTHSVVDHNGKLNGDYDSTCYELGVCPVIWIDLK